jgi:uncharacterized protein YcbX
MIEIGRVKQLYRYPVKSMAGETLNTATLGWHGIAGDRRFAFRRVQETGGFPWLTAGRLPAMIRYQPGGANGDGVPAHVKTPEGAELALYSDALRDELSAQFGAELQLMQLKHGIFDEAALSLITTATLTTIGAKAETEIDPRRFRPNILVETSSAAPFPEDEWVGKLIVFGEAPDAPALSVAQRDVRCAMVNLDPDSGMATPQILKAVVQANQICAGVYGAAFRIGQISVGDRVFVLDV